jgi:hypothetical protein
MPQEGPASSARSTTASATPMQSQPPMLHCHPPELLLLVCRRLADKVQLTSHQTFLQESRVPL